MNEHEIKTNDSQPAPSRVGCESGSVHESSSSEGSYQILQDRTNPELRVGYVRNTERLIAHIIDDDIHEVVFLDKSARPVAWLMKSLWPTLGVNAEGEQLPIPGIHFVNIDREQWGSIVGRSEDEDGGMIAIHRVPDETIAGLRKIFVKEPLGPDDDSKSTPTYFGDGEVLVIDEVKSSGDTLDLATKLFTRAFPEAKTSGLYWMTPKVVTKKSGIRANADLPVWYRNDKVEGRLVANRSTYESSQSPSSHQRNGKDFLSTRFNEPDQVGLRLRREMKQLGQDVANGFIPVTPPRESVHWSKEQRERFVQRVNGISLEEFVSLKRQATIEDKPFSELFVQYKCDRRAA